MEYSYSALIIKINKTSSITYYYKLTIPDYYLSSQIKYSKQMAKFNKMFRHKQCSAPLMFGILICVCMFIVYLMEIIGIAHKESNLVYRLNKIEVASENTVGYWSRYLNRKETYMKEKENKRMRLLFLIYGGMVSQGNYEKNIVTQLGNIINNNNNENTNVENENINNIDYYFDI